MSGRRWPSRTRTWAWLPPLPLPVPPPLLPPPLPCLCCWDPVISAILLSICSSRSRMDILNWLSRAEHGRVRLCFGRMGINPCPVQPVGWASKTITHSTRSPGFVQAGDDPDTSHKTVAVTAAQVLNERNRKTLSVKVVVSGSGTPFLCQIPQWKP